MTVFFLELLVIGYILFSVAPMYMSGAVVDEFQDEIYSRISIPTFPCTINNTSGVPFSHVGQIGLKGDTAESPKQPFFWFFEAETARPKKSPLILRLGSDLGESALLSALSGPAPCALVENGTVFNPHRWTERFNLLVLDYPGSVGYSKAQEANNFHLEDAALDVYDFLQKFFKLHPGLERNSVVISAGGSFGGLLAPYIGSVIQNANKALARKKGSKRDVHIRLDSIMLSGSILNPASYFRWHLHDRCSRNIYDPETCLRVYGEFPACLYKIQSALQNPTVESNIKAGTFCYETLFKVVMNNTQFFESPKCAGYDNLKDAPPTCQLSLAQANEFFGNPSVQDYIGLDYTSFNAWNAQIESKFHSTGELIRPYHILYEKLIKDGVRLLNYVGSEDSTNPWSETVSDFERQQTPFQGRFLREAGSTWRLKDSPNATVRSIGVGAGTLTHILISEAAPFVKQDQSALVKSIVEHWITNQPFQMDLEDDDRNQWQLV
ncbi:hypothetical protein M422DRAFT_68859 [Sphaerobolus stellatus SS14]|uniref:Carboxypeptidase n=1 Tax=Sphaerobolus stellatus (strain SS14) TaxID=990650 RepID=A0A0C9UWR1_SPHS4|nr:hypothetical protein M422DRAFT_68859 [Sphaerobolus stellatus SS14]